MTGRTLPPRRIAFAVPAFALLASLPAARAEQATDEAIQERQLWTQEAEMLERNAAERDGYNPLERTLVGIVLLDKAELAEEDLANLQAVDVGRFSTKGQEFVLRVENAGLFDLLRKAPERKPLTLTGTLRANGKYFVARGVSLVVPGQGSAAPEPRRRRGGL